MSKNDIKDKKEETIDISKIMLTNFDIIREGLSKTKDIIHEADECIQTFIKSKTIIDVVNFKNNKKKKDKVADMMIYYLSEYDKNNRR
jgi:hypothetical protein